MSRGWIHARALASALLAGEWTVDAMVERAARVVGAQRWLRRVARKLLLQFPTAPRDARDALARAILRHRSAKIERLRHRLIDEPAMGTKRWDVPELATLADLDAWLELPPGQLDWAADRKGLERLATDERLRNYRYVWVPKRSGGVRLLEIPKTRLARIQRKILHEILDRVPAHQAAHGFSRGRSIVSCAAPHAGQEVVVRMDLEDFFSSVRSPRLTGLFRSMGYPEEVARTLSSLCCNRVPNGVIDVGRRDAHVRAKGALPDARGAILDRFARHARHLAEPHLPQGAPTSPALSNLAARGLDVRLSGLARSMDATYTRYADDLVLSGGRALARDDLHALVAAIAVDEGFAVNHRKTRVMRQGVRQHVTSVTVNARPNVDRETFDRLKAILTNCARHGPTAQNRENHPDFAAHLRGRIAWVSMLSKARGEKLRALYETIVWPA
ncbi:MAG: reverse transcriptase family protein [Polyangiales bacterium]